MRVKHPLRYLPKARNTFKQNKTISPRSSILNILKLLSPTVFGVGATLLTSYYSYTLQFRASEFDRAEKAIIKTHTVLNELHNSLVAISTNLSSKDPEVIKSVMKKVIIDVPEKRRQLLLLHDELAFSFGNDLANIIIKEDDETSNIAHSEEVSCKSADSLSMNPSFFDLYYYMACGIALTAAADFPVALAHLDVSGVSNPNFHANNLAIAFQRLDGFERATTYFTNSLSSILTRQKPSSIGFLPGHVSSTSLPP